MKVSRGNVSITVRVPTESPTFNVLSSVPGVSRMSEGGVLEGSEPPGDPWSTRPVLHVSG